MAGLLVTSIATLAAQDPAGPTPPSANQAPTDASARLIEDLVSRIRELERRDTERARAAERSSEELAKKLQDRITELEGKVKSLEGGHIVPEISVTPSDAPSAAELDQKLRILERKDELAAEAAAAKAKEAPQLSIGPAGFVVSSADTHFVLRVRGIVQGDTRTFFDDNPLSQGNEGFFLRRARPIIEGTVFRDFDFQLVPDFGGSNVQIFDANVSYRLRPELRFKIGKFKGAVGFENLIADAALPFNERSFASALVANRNLGAQLEGDAFDGYLSYAAGVFNSTGDGKVAGTADFGDDPEFAARISTRPFQGSNNDWLKGLTFGLAGSYSQISSNAVGLSSTTGGVRPGYTTPGLQQFFAYNSPSGTVVADGIHWRLDPYVSYLNGPFGLLGEYVQSQQGVLNSTTLRQADLTHSAWQVSGQWVLTGESASLTGINPLRPFRPSDGSWGAWQLVARYSAFDADPDTFRGFAAPTSSAAGANAWSVGINWWLNRNLRVLTSFSLTSFDGGGVVNPADPTSKQAPATVTHQDEKALLTRVQLAF